MRLKVKNFCQIQRWGRAGTGTLDLMISVEFRMLACPTLPPTGRRGKCGFISHCIYMWNLVFKSLLTVMVSRGLSSVSRKHRHFQGQLREKEEWCKMNLPRIKKGEAGKEKEGIRWQAFRAFLCVHISSASYYKNADLDSAGLEWDLGFWISSELPDGTLVQGL